MEPMHCTGSATINTEAFYTDDLQQDDWTEGVQSFAVFFRRALRELCASEGRKITTKDVADAVGISYELFRKIVNRQKPTKKRDCIIAICAVLRVSVNAANKGLSLYGGMQLLDEYAPRDDVLWGILAEQACTPKTIAEINSVLTEQRFPPLDIITHKKTNLQQRSEILFQPVRKNVQCTIEGIGRLSNPDCFLDLLYDTACFYHTRTCMEYLSGGRRYELCIQYRRPQGAHTENLYQRAVRSRISPPQKKYIVYTYPTDQLPSELLEFTDMDETGRFRPYFQEIEKAERAERQKRCETVDDTRNYGMRIAAGVIDHALHVFCETYNSDVPELSEYYLMDWCGGTYTLYILRSSGFMKLYLPGARYEQAFGRPNDLYQLYISPTGMSRNAAGFSDPVAAYFSSEEEIEDFAYEARDVGMLEPYGENAMVALRLRAYRKMQAAVDTMIAKLKAGEAQICSSAVLEDEAYDLILTGFGVKDAFADAEPEQKRALSLSDGQQVSLSVTDLFDAFALGLKTVDEAAAFLTAHGTLKISELL